MAGVVATTGLRMTLVGTDVLAETVILSRRETISPTSTK